MEDILTNIVSFPALGLQLSISSVALKIGSFNIYWYGVLIATGMALALVFAFSRCKLYGIDQDKFIDVIAIGTVGAIICARAYYVAFAPFKYTSFLKMINIRDGGLAIYGAILGAIVFGGAACIWRKQKLTAVFDIAAVGFLIGQGIGRWGNFFNQEAFGTNTNSIFGMISPATTSYLASVQAKLAATGVTVDPLAPVHPTFLYESAWCLLGALLLAFYMKRRKFDGEIALLYVVWYGLERAFVEGLRTDSLAVGALRVSQVLAIVSAVIAAAILIYFYIKNKKRAVHNG